MLIMTPLRFSVLFDTPCGTGYLQVPHVPKAMPELLTILPHPPTAVITSMHHRHPTWLCAALGTESSDSSCILPKYSTE